jgi:hypothetical protein
MQKRVTEPPTGEADQPRTSLRSRCHGIEWQASPRETEQIREYLWAAQLA